MNEIFALKATLEERDENRKRIDTFIFQAVNNNMPFHCGRDVLEVIQFELAQLDTDHFKMRKENERLKQDSDAIWADRIRLQNVIKRMLYGDELSNEDMIIIHEARSAK